MPKTWLGLLDSFSTWVNISFCLSHSFILLFLCFRCVLWWRGDWSFSVVSYHHAACDSFPSTLVQNTIQLSPSLAVIFFVPKCDKLSHPSATLQPQAERDFSDVWLGVLHWLLGLSKQTWIMFLAYFSPQGNTFWIIDSLSFEINPVDNTTHIHLFIYFEVPDD